MLHAAIFLYVTRYRIRVSNIPHVIFKEICESWEGGGFRRIEAMRCPWNYEWYVSWTWTLQAELDYLAMKRENKNLKDENSLLQARLRLYMQQMASQVRQ